MDSMEWYVVSAWVKYIHLYLSTFYVDLTCFTLIARTD